MELLFMRLSVLFRLRRSGRKWSVYFRHPAYIYVRQDRFTVYTLHNKALVGRNFDLAITYTMRPNISYFESLF